MEREAFIKSHLAIGCSVLVPEIRLYLASELTPLWLATESFLAQHNMAPPYWAFSWPGSEALARYILDNPALVSGKRVLDFAAGAGLAGIAAAKAGAIMVEAAEIDPLAGGAVRLNAQLNQVEVSVCVDNLVGQDGGWDVIVAGDVCYEHSMAATIIPWLRHLAECKIVLLADPGRRYGSCGIGRILDRYEVPTSLELEQSVNKTTVIYEISAGVDQAGQGFNPNR